MYSTLNEVFVLPRPLPVLISVVISPCMMLEENARVNMLIDKKTRSCNPYVIDAIFLPHEGELIKAISYG